MAAEGLFDIHVHCAPDVTARRADDLDTVAGYARAGFSGCVLKAHYDNTIGRAAAVGRQHPELQVFGGLALNQQVGGFNPAAVAAALTMGARVIWMPTADAHTQATAGLPRLCGQRADLAGTTYAAPPVDPRTESALRQILALIAEADAVLATGHLSGPEIDWLLTAAEHYGLRRVLLTHPSYTVPDLTASQAAEFAERGALLEVTAFQLRQSGWDAARLAAFVRAAGLRHLVLSSDAGQPDSPPPPEALHRLIDVLAAQGIDRSALLEAASSRPRELVVH